LGKKKPLRLAEVLYIFLKKIYNSVSAEGSGILQDILQTIDFIFYFLLMGQICKLFFNRPNKNRNNFYYPINLVCLC
jgi:hypothetical protein